MTTTEIVSKLLPLALALIMFSLGITLTREDFARIFKAPKAIATGLFVQIILVPIFAFGLCKIFGLDPELSVGLMLLAASPGGVTANLFSHLAGGDVALNVTLTAVNSVIAAVTVPLLVWLSMNTFLAQDQFIGLQFGKMIEVFVIVLVPVFLGMTIHARYPFLRAKIEKPFNVFSILFLVFVVIAAITKEQEMLAQSLAQIGLMTLIFNVGSLAMGYFAARSLKLSQAQSIGIGLEIGIHNVTLAFYLAYTVLGNTRFAVPSAVYGIIMYFVAGALTAAIRMKAKAGLAPARISTRD